MKNEDNELIYFLLINYLFLYIYLIPKNLIKIYFFLFNKRKTLNIKKFISSSIFKLIINNYNC